MTVKSCSGIYVFINRYASCCAIRGIIIREENSQTICICCRDARVVGMVVVI